MRTPAGPDLNGPVRTVALVARRELVTRVQTKSFLVSNAVILLLILGGIVAAAVVSGRSDSRADVGLVGSATSLSAPLSRVGGEPVKVSTVPDEATARAQVTAGDLDVAVLAGGPGSYTLVVEEEVAPELRAVLDAVVRQQAVDSAVSAQGGDPAELAAAVERAVLTIDAVDPPNPDRDQRTALAFIAMLLMFFQILTFGIYVAMGVVEEKSSRVVEVLLATISPLQLLCGKVVGIGLVGLVQLAAYGVVGLSAGLGTSLVTVTGTAVGVFASVLGWFVLGFAFFAVLYAAAGSMVSRQEDVNSVATPITMLVLVSYFLAQVSVQDPGGTVASVMSWIPPFSAMIMPLRIAAGTTGVEQIVGSAALMLVATAALAVAAARIYERSVLRTGKRVSLREAVGAPR